MKFCPCCKSTLPDDSPFEDFKKCRKCEKWKPLTEFGKRKDAPDGKHPRCKICYSKDKVVYHAKRKNEEYFKKLMEENPPTD